LDMTLGGSSRGSQEAWVEVRGGDLAFPASELVDGNYQPPAVPGGLDAEFLFDLLWVDIGQQDLTINILEKEEA